MTKDEKAWRRVGFSVLVFLLLILPLSAQVELMPLSEVRVGQQGEWKTVVEGNRLQSFRLEVLGIAENFVGPQAAVIICKALDDEHIRSGPVAGMSGSPVYIGGRLVGAYAYGFPWQKEQALIGVTPIEQMLGVLDLEEDRQEREARSDGGAVEAISSSFDKEVSWQGNVLAASPTSLQLGGFSADTLAVFAESLQELGMEAMQGSLSSKREEMEAVLEPGYPVAAVYMQGDFSAAGVGTITWRSGDRLLAFGHAMAKGGDVFMPMAGAEIITIVQGLQRSFKLSQVGPVLGSIRQDRLPAVMGDLQKVPEMLPLTFRLMDGGALTQDYRADLFRDANLSPLLMAMALQQVIGNTVYAGKKVTMQVEAQVHFDDGEVVPVHYASSNPNGVAGALALYFYQKILPLWNNVFARSQISAIDFEVKVEAGTQWFALEKAWLSQSLVQPGQELELRVHLRRYQEEAEVLDIRVPVPSVLAGERVRLLIGDATTAYRTAQQGTMVDSYGDLRNNLEALRSNDAIYVQWIRQTEGLSLGGERLADMPPSVLDLMSSPKSVQPQQRWREAVVEETVIPVDGVFQGFHSFVVEVESL